MPKQLYRIPSMPFIGQQAKGVYKAESAIGSHLDKLCLALAPYLEKIVGRDIDPENELYQTLVPEALASMLNKYDHSSALAACIGYLRRELRADVTVIRGDDNIPGFEIRIPGSSTTIAIDATTLPLKGGR